jgi:hypothetical protein
VFGIKSKKQTIDNSNQGSLFNPSETPVVDYAPKKRSKPMRVALKSNMLKMMLMVTAYVPLIMCLSALLMFLALNLQGKT